MTDAIVVGSGAAGVNAAWPLVERGLSVTMLDYGNEDTVYAPLVPDRPWSELRRGDEGQARYFLGDRFEGVPFGEVRVGAQLTPPRMFITADTEELTPVASDTFGVSESLAKGGLASGWGAGVFPFDDDDLTGAPFSRGEIDPHYEAVAERIGVSGARDDLLPFLGDCEAMMPPLELDSAAEAVLERYGSRREQLNRAGFHLGRTRLAACSRAHRGRDAHPYLDMDFWSDAGRSVYRPRWTLDELREFDNFRYLDRRLVLTFREDGEGAEVACRLADGGERETHRARAVVLAAGTLGTARIVLRSLDRYDRPLPVLCNPYTYAPVVNLGMVGRKARDRRHSLAQLTAVYRPNPDEPAVVAQYYSYRSLLTYKLMKESPLGYKATLSIMRLLTPIFGVLGMHHQDVSSPAKTCTLRRGGDGPDKLAIEYRPSDGEERRHAAAETAVLACFRKLGCRALKRIRPGHGSSIHYAGTLPYRAEGGELTTDAASRLHGTRAVHVADGSVFSPLSAKGLTFTIMANADRVGALLADELG